MDPHTPLHFESSPLKVNYAFIFVHFIITGGGGIDLFMFNRGFGTLGRCGLGGSRRWVMVEGRQQGRGLTLMDDRELGGRCHGRCWRAKNSTLLTHLDVDGRVGRSRSRPHLASSRSCTTPLPKQ
eukprot:scaffold11106_cov49-Cyclotella_meneghiniana.AAC.1